MRSSIAVAAGVAVTARARIAVAAGIAIAARLAIAAGVALAVAWWLFRVLRDSMG